MRLERLLSPSIGPGRPSLLLTGPSASGKSAAGQLAAQLLGLQFVDLDQLAEERAGKSVAEIFSQDGEVHFRELEAQLLHDAAQLSGAVVASGGGAVLRPDLLREFPEGTLRVGLRASPEVLLERLGRSGPRPLLGPDPGSALRQLLTQREAAYAAAGAPLDTRSRSVEEVGAELKARYRSAVPEGPTRIPVRIPGAAYDVVIGSGALRLLPALLEPLMTPSGRVAVVFDRAVEETAGALVQGLLQGSGRELAGTATGPGEAGKQLAAVARLWDRFQELQLDRGDLVVAVGGGATLDAVGFAAATWARGVPWASVPTTVLAMADAAIGGKVAIDRAGAKNSVGSLHQPKLVLADPELLATLPAEIARDGLAEVVKVGILASPLLLDLLRAGEEPPRTGWLVEQAARIKAAYVASDPEDHGVRQALNLGHTFGHGVEAASNYRVPHGRGVALGLVASSRLAVKLGLIRPRLGDEVAATLRHLGLLTPPPHLDRDQVVRAILVDKKRRGGSAVFVLPTPPGASLALGLEPEVALGPLWELLSELGEGPTALVAGSGREVRS